jgi:hypothetical protein
LWAFSWPALSISSRKEHLPGKTELVINNWQLAIGNWFKLVTTDCVIIAIKES